jgi:hypothetical protein
LDCREVIISRVLGINARQGSTRTNPNPIPKNLSLAGHRKYLVPVILIMWIGTA